MQFDFNLPISGPMSSPESMTRSAPRAIQSPIPGNSGPLLSLIDGDREAQEPPGATQGRQRCPLAGQKPSGK